MPPPDKQYQPQARAGSSISASNETSFAFLGARRPSWMTSGAPSAPGPRTNNDGSTRAHAIATPRAKQPTKTSAAHHAPPSGIAMQLNAQAELEAQSHDTASSAAVALPSPTPSSGPNSAASTPVPGESTTCANGSTVTERQTSASISSGILPVTVQASVLLPASGHISPSGASCQPAVGQFTQSINSTAEASLANTLSGLNAPESSVPNDLPTPPRPLASELAGPSSAASKRKGSTSEASASENTSENSSGDTFSDAGRKRSRVEDGSQQAVASTSPQSLKPVLVQWREQIEDRLHSYRISESLPQLDRLRYKLLRDACLRVDPLYIVLHQVFCLWSLNRQEAYTLLKSPSRVVDLSFELLLCALRNNSELSPAHLEWFSSFPLHVNAANVATLGGSEIRDVFRQVNAFIAHLATGWQQLLVSIDSRKYPLMIWEMKDILKCESIVLQEIFFTSSRRRLAPDASIQANEILRVFAWDRKNESATVEGSKRSIVRANLAEKYKFLILQARTKANPTESSSNSATTPSCAQPLVRSTLDGQAAPSASQRDQLTQQTHSPTMQQYQTPNGAAIQPSALHPGTHGNGSSRSAGPTVRSRFALRSSIDEMAVSRPIPRPTAIPSSSQVPAHQPAAHQPTLPQTTHMTQMAASTPIFERPDPAVSIASQSAQTWQPTQRSVQYFPDPASPHISPYLLQGEWAGNQGLQQQSSLGTAYLFGMQQQSSPVTPYPFGVQQQSSPGTWYHYGQHVPHPQQTTSVTQQPMQAWSSHAFRPENPAVARSYSTAMRSYPRNPPLVRAMAQVPPVQVRSRAASPTQSQHEIVRLPETEHPPNEHDWTSLRHGLHLVHLRSPRRFPRNPSELQTRYYQFVSHFAVEPRAILPKLGLEEIEFSVSQEDLCKVVKVSGTSTLPMALYSGESLRYRLRLCRAAARPMTLSNWPISPSFWPQHIFLTFNGKAVHPRRGQHFHHDLPIELSDSLKLGVNAVKISLPAVAANVNKKPTFFVAIEIVTTLDYAAVRSLIDRTQHCSSDDTRREIARRLMPVDSDDVIVEDDVLTVSIADPFSSVLFTTPVRGVSCKHIECFDLEIWLETRRGKPSHGYPEPSLVDDWKCPICGLDARPVSLRIDDYFSEVRQKLVEDGCGSTKKIRIKADGSWTAVQEAEDDEAEDERHSASQIRVPARTERATNRDTAAMPIIILDDD